LRSSVETFQTGSAGVVENVFNKNSAAEQDDAGRLEKFVLCSLLHQLVAQRSNRTSANSSGYASPDFLCQRNASLGF